MKTRPTQKGDAYSVDLREKAPKTKHDNGLTQEQTGEFFGIGQATVYRWERLKRERGSVNPRAHGGGAPRRVLAEHETALRQLLHEKNDRTLAELTRALEERTGLDVSPAAVWDALDRMGFTLKKETLTASERDRPDGVRARPA